MSSIASRLGLDRDAVWGDAANAALRASCRRPSTLRPGDVLALPEPRRREEPAATGARHRFVASTAMALLHVRLLVNDRPVADAEYVVRVDGRPELRGKTSPSGFVREEIPADAREALLIVPKRKIVRRIALGHLDPVHEVTGAQARLRQLGRYAGAVDGVMSKHFVRALERFQARSGLPQTGALDAATLDALAHAYGV